MQLSQERDVENPGFGRSAGVKIGIFLQNLNCYKKRLDYLQTELFRIIVLVLIGDLVFDVVCVQFLLVVTILCEVWATTQKIYVSLMYYKIFLVVIAKMSLELLKRSDTTPCELLI